LTVTYLNGKYRVATFASSDSEAARFQIDPATNVATPVAIGGPLACNTNTCLGAAGTGVARFSSAGAQLDDPPIGVNAPARPQTKPVVVAGAGEYLAVWTENVGDPPNNVLHAGRLDASGAPLDPTPALIGDHAFVIDSTFDGTDFVVLWLTGPANDSSLRFTRISPAGVVRDPGGILITRPQGTSVNSALACSATDCLVVWSASFFTFPQPPPGISATRVDKDGTLLDSTPFQVLASAEPWMLHYTGNGYLMQVRTGSLVGGTLKLDATGHAIGTPTAGSQQVLHPCGSNYISFAQLPFGSWFKFVPSLFDANAMALQPSVDFGGIATTAPSVASTATGCMLGWSQLQGDSYDAYVNLIDGSGTGASSTPLAIASDPDFSEFSPTLAVGSDGKMLATYVHVVAQAPYGNFRIGARSIAPSGTSGNDGEGGESSSNGGSTSTGGASSVGGSADIAGSNGIAGSGVETTGGSGATGGESGSGAETAGGSGATGGESGSGAAGSSGATGGASGATHSGGASGQSSCGAAHGGAAYGGAGMNGTAGDHSGHGASGGCALSPHREPERNGLAVAFLLMAIAAWGRARARRSDP